MKTVSIRNQTIHYQDQGEGHPILFGHSYLWDSRMWSPQIEALASTHRCIAPDLWAHGQSDLPPDGPVDIKTLAADMLRFADALNLETFSVVGLSVGGMWGGQLALDAMDRVRSLTIMNSYVGPEPADSQQKYFGMLDTVEQLKGIPPPMQDAIVPLFFSPVTQRERPELIESFKAELSGIDPVNVASIVAIGREIFSRASLLDQLPDLTIPTLVLVGEDDLSRPPHESQDMKDRIPGSELHSIPQAGHISSLEQPAVVNEHLQRFLSALA